METETVKKKGKSIIDGESLSSSKKSEPDRIKMADDSMRLGIKCDIPYAVQKEDGTWETRQGDTQVVTFTVRKAQGSGIETIPVSEFAEYVKRLSVAVETGVAEKTEVIKTYRPTFEVLSDTLATVTSTDADGNVIDGEKMIEYRSRDGQGSKFTRVSEKQFPELVKLLNSVLAAIPNHSVDLESKINKMKKDLEKERLNKEALAASE